MLLSYVKIKKNLTPTQNILNKVTKVYHIHVDRKTVTHFRSSLQTHLPHYLTCLRITNVRMGVAVTWDAGSEGTSIGWAMAVARSTGLTVLSHIALRACAHFNPGSRHSIQPSAGSLKTHIIQEASPWESEHQQ